MTDQAEVLEHDSSAVAILRKRLSRRFGELVAEQANPAARRPLRQVEQLEQRSLACSRWPGEKIEAALAEAEVEIAQDFRSRAVAQADAVEFRNVWQCAFPSRRQSQGDPALPSSAHSCLPCAHRPGRGLLLQ